MNTINPTSCLLLPAFLLVASFSFGIRANIPGDLRTQFNLRASKLTIIASTAFRGFLRK